jgi:hypothetical protein
MGTTRHARERQACGVPMHTAVHSQEMCKEINKHMAHNHREPVGCQKLRCKYLCAGTTQAPATRPLKSPLINNSWVRVLGEQPLLGLLYPIHADNSALHCRSAGTVDMRAGPA